jgi:hypothetical protein
MKQMKKTTGFMRLMVLAVFTCAVMLMAVGPVVATTSSVDTDSILLKSDAKISTQTDLSRTTIDSMVTGIVSNPIAERNMTTHPPILTGTQYSAADSILMKKSDLIQAANDQRPAALKSSTTDTDGTYAAKNDMTICGDIASVAILPGEMVKMVPSESVSGDYRGLNFSSSSGLPAPTDFKLISYDTQTCQGFQSTFPAGLSGA